VFEGDGFPETRIRPRAIGIKFLGAGFPERSPEGPLRERLMVREQRS
jgi:hypothetical protein